MTPEFSRSKGGRRTSITAAEQDGHVSVTVRPSFETLEPETTLVLTEDDFEWLIQSAGPAVLMALRRDRPPAD